MCTLCFASGRTGEFSCDQGLILEGEVSIVSQTVASEALVFSNDQIAFQLTNVFWGGQARAFNVGVGGTISVNITALTAAGQNLAVQAFELWSAATGLNFSFTSNSAQIEFDDTDAWSAYSWSSVSGSVIDYSYVNVGTSWINYYGSGVNTYSLQTYIHEIGHALGLGHAGNYNGSATYGVDNHYANDSWQASLMSYFSQNENTSIDASYLYAVTPQVADVIAIRNLYSTNWMTRTGNTIYGDDANSGDLMQTISSMKSYINYTIVDDGGLDTMNFSSHTGNQTIDLRQEAISSVRGYTGNVIIARGTVIENAIGGGGADQLIGNDEQNVLEGQSGNDVLNGMAGDDLLIGGEGGDWLEGSTGNDWALYSASTAGVLVVLGDGVAERGGSAQGDVLLNVENILGSSFGDILAGDGLDNNLNGSAGEDALFGGSGNDALFGGQGTDWLDGGNGGDWLDGGSGTDWARYDSSSAAVVVVLGDGQVERGGDAQNDVLVEIENLLGSSFDDILAGSSGFNELVGGMGNDALYGGEGDDLLIGGIGADLLHGGPGSDWAHYCASWSGVVVVLADGVTESGADAQGDMLVDIENLMGSDFDDILAGTTGDNFLSGAGGNDAIYGGIGNDFLEGGAGGDWLDGGPGSDWVIYSASAQAVSVNLLDGLAESGGEAENDVLVDVENVLGSANADTIVGNAADNYLSGYAGSDKLDGGLGNDTLEGGQGNNILTGGAGADTFLFVTSEARDEVTDFEIGIDTVAIGFGLSSFSEITVSDAGANTTLTFAGTQVTLNDVYYLNLDADDFSFV